MTVSSTVRASVVALSLLLAPTTVVAAPAAAVADETATLDRMVEMNRKALESLKGGRADAARDGLLSAVELGKQAGLETHQMMARTYLHLGAVYLSGFKDRDNAIRQLVLALKLRPTIQMTAQLATPALTEAFEAARAEVGQPQGGPGAPPPPAPIASEARPEPAAPPPAPAPPPANAPAPPPALAAADPGVEGGIGPAPGDESTTVDVEDEALLDESATRWWVSVGVGSGLGWHSGRDLEGQNDFEVPSGVASAALIHVGPEIGYRVSDRFALSLQSRHQIIPSTGRTIGPDQRRRTAHAVFARGHWLLGTPGGVQLAATATVGAGSAFRFYVPARPTRKLNASDTVAAGPLALGPGVSVLWRASDHIGVIAELRALFGAPKTALLADVTFGATYGF